MKQEVSVEVVVRTISKSEATDALNTLRSNGFNVSHVDRGPRVSGRRCDVLDDDQIDELMRRVADNYTPYDLLEMLDVGIWDVIERFREEIIEADKNGWTYFE